MTLGVTCEGTCRPSIRPGQAEAALGSKAGEDSLEIESRGTTSLVQLPGRWGFRRENTCSVPLEVTPWGGGSHPGSHRGHSERETYVLYTCRSRLAGGGGGHVQGHTGVTADSCWGSDKYLS